MTQRITYKELRDGLELARVDLTSDRDSEKLNEVIESTVRTWLEVNFLCNE